MEVFVQQVINGVTLGSIYGLIAIGYTMVFGIIGMVNFAHGDVFMVSAFIALVTFLLLTTWLGFSSLIGALVVVLIVAMLLTSLVNWTIERMAYRPLRGSSGSPPSYLHLACRSFFPISCRSRRGLATNRLPPCSTK